LPDPAHTARLHARTQVLQRLAGLKRRSGLFGFADLLQRLDVALADPESGERLAQRLDPTAALMQRIQSAVRRRPQRIVFAEGEEPAVIRAAYAYQEQGLGEAILIGREEQVLRNMALVGLPEDAFEALAGLDVWIVDALRWRPHPTHAHVDLALEWAARLKPRRTILTNMHIDLDFTALSARLPPGV
jgi:hypothetical protein